MLRVVKVGGSLLLRRDFSVAVREWIARQSPGKTFVVFGGGELIDAVRRLDQVHSFDAATIHWMCVDLLHATFRLACSRFEDWTAIDSTQQLDRIATSCEGDGETFLVSVRSFYDSHLGSELPVTWETTTDSIAAELAVRVKAAELVLLKSCEVDPDAGVVQLARKGIVDPTFPGFAAKVPAFRVERLP